MSTERSTAGEPAVSSRSSIAASAGVGVLTAAISYLVTYLLIGNEVGERFGDRVAEWKGVAWYFYEAHMVDIEASGQLGSISGTGTLDLIAETGGVADLLYVIVPFALIVAGAGLAVRLGASELGDAITIGIPVMIGYSAVLSVGAVAAESTGGVSVGEIELISGTIAPALVPAVLLGGVIYPLVFATLGAAIATILASR
ncbi:hypothetical protein C488_19882 [Natrinema pellirubrum DSM 15624]|uniref:DUF7978 domain-containing protein n=1 Tax=Natrinema pellirubrum (strain DSM 15624 / CIP 106293 / JCM 10476 / NCIMB 786 / 157) TaxID=797303 RepID=L0JHV8_NATP1|nr:hypothetical protein [Natrinema pellirubrum]AGB30157.1 hypothetical protein Natpe_0217 [Natrinema pellirubrum DSM 15624]ELY69863.1 hypothetical protein C488_19882 [Natrinema pellirubrum DSM 15624]